MKPTSDLPAALPLPPAIRADAVLALTGGGDMGARMRAFDWSATSLGPVTAWPQSLRTAVSICLASRFPILVWWGPDLVKIYNDAYAPILGSKHPSALGARGRDVWPEIWHIIGPMLEAVMTRGEATWSEDQMLPLERRGFAEECYFTFSYSPIRDESGGVGGVFTAVTETTERVLSERRLAALRALSERTIRESASAEEACRAAAQVLDASEADVPFALVYLIDDDGRTARLAARTASLEGHGGCPEVVALDGDAPDAPWPIARVARTWTTETVLDLAGRGGEFPGGAWPEPANSALVLPIARGARGAGGAERPEGILVAGVSPRRPLDDTYGGFFHLVAGHIGTAVANARAHEENRRRVEALAELDRAKTAFFSNVSHEHRTPLGLVLGNLEDVLSGARGELTGAQREALDMAHRNALRLLRLVNTLLDFSRIEAGRVRAVYEPVALGEYTAELASSFRSAVERAGLRLVVDAPPLPQPAYVDRDMWEKIVLNLLSNAFKYTFEGEIEVRVRARGGAAELTVRDTGVGIPPEELPRVFERFHRVPNARSRTHEGTGIGLALVQEIVRLHGGTIGVESTVGAGTTFTVTIPFGTAHLPGERVATVAGVTARSSTALGATPYVEEALRWLPSAGGEGEPQPAVDAPRILLADDNADMRDYVARLLRAQGWRVDAVADGAAALAAVRARAPDLVLSDVMMPVLDGHQLLRELRRDARTASLPVILLSARAGEEARVEGAQAGADDYLVKPFAAQELVARVATHLALARERARAAAATASARDLLTRVLEQAPVGICVLNGPDHVFEVANAAYRRFLPAGRSVIGRPLREVLPETQEQGFIALLDRVYRTGEPWIGRSVELLYDRHGDGRLETAYFNALYHPLADPDGRVRGVIAVAAEVTDEVLARREAEAARHEAEEANRAKSDFLAVMSHELRTPLNAIAGHVQLMELEIHGPLTEGQRGALERIERNQRHLLGLINDVLNLARIESGRVEYAMADVSLQEVVAGLAPITGPQLAAKGLWYDVHLPDALPRVRADRDKLAQILINLLSNATKFTPRGGRVTLTAESRAPRNGDGPRVIVRVRDTGPGIAPEKLQAIFEPFVQVHSGPTRINEGAGLGLAISRDLARGMGGELTAASELGKGAEFVLEMTAAP